DGLVEMAQAGVNVQELLQGVAAQLGGCIRDALKERRRLQQPARLVLVLRLAIQLLRDGALGERSGHPEQRGEDARGHQSRAAASDHGGPPRPVPSPLKERNERSAAISSVRTY